MLIANRYCDARWEAESVDDWSVVGRFVVNATVAVIWTDFDRCLEPGSYHSPDQSIAPWIQRIYAHTNPSAPPPTTKEPLLEL